MSKIFINEETLTNIGNAIREKTGKAALIAPGLMPDEIRNIQTSGGSSELPEEALSFTGDCMFTFAGTSWNWLLNNYGDKIQTVDITNAESMFEYNTTIEEIPFTIHLADYFTGSFPFKRVFSDCYLLLEVPYIDGSKLSSNSSGSQGTDMSYFFYNAQNVRNIPNDYFIQMGNEEFWQAEQQKSANRGNIFYGCYSLRELPDLLPLLNRPSSGISSLYYNLASNCYSLNKMMIPVLNTTISSNMFTNICAYCFRLKDMLFLTDENNTPYTVNWKKQTIDLSGVGYSSYSDTSNIVKYNSGITLDKQVIDDASYQALKDDPDWFTTDIAYSRYNHTSAVNTINSLPDTSAAGGVNTIKFAGAAGSATDGGAINTLTVEEIAVATEKGWTVSIV